MGRRRKKLTIVHTSWEPWGSFDCRGLGDFDIASQYYFQSVFSVLDALWTIFTEAQKMTVITSCGALLSGQYAVTKLTIPPPKPHSWSPVMSWARLDGIPSKVAMGPCSPNSCGIYFNVRKRTEQLFERGAETWLELLTGDLIVLLAKHSPALPGFGVLQQSEICCSECNE